MFNALLAFMRYWSLNIFPIVSSLNTFILNRSSTRIKFHTMVLSAVFQEEQSGKGAWVGRCSFNLPTSEPDIIHRVIMFPWQF